MPFGVKKIQREVPNFLGVCYSPNMSFIHMFIVIIFLEFKGNVVLNKWKKMKTIRLEIIKILILLISMISMSAQEIKLVLKDGNLQRCFLL
jgi:hypothetical protein